MKAAARRRAGGAPDAADADGGGSDGLRSPAFGSLDAELAAPVAALSEKWKLLPAFLKVRAIGGGSEHALAAQ